jgi:transketolase
MSNSLDLVTEAKITSLKLAHNANASHIGGAFSIADVLSVLYCDVLNYNVSEPQWKERDRLFYSKGHACTILYSILNKCGFISDKMLDTFSKNGSYLTTHVNSKVPGIELSTGSLGHAMGVACGVALAGKLRKESWKTFCIVSDGELDEGSNWEAIMFAAHKELSNLTLIVDYNKIQSFGTVKEVMNLDPLMDKFKAFNFYILDIDGHDHNAILDALKDNRNGSMPKVIIANTIKGKGVDYMEHQLAWHYKSPDAEQLNNALSQLNSK